MTIVDRNKLNAKHCGIIAAQHITNVNRYILLTTLSLPNLMFILPITTLNLP